MVVLVGIEVVGEGVVVVVGGAEACWYCLCVVDRFVFVGTQFASATSSLPGDNAQVCVVTSGKLLAPLFFNLYPL